MSKKLKKLTSVKKSKVKVQKACQTKG